ncbi:uroporphyrinogen-III synthase [Undibacterium sp.]|uniref:uroporphyrinogen-III synthase n=1 Tax=Undibacterium sp. TaxID=1914977 RepID=UPI002C3C5DE0|nr:uroporphyrinogen-III synthase [Undibacterium sp.]HTD05285.1 uroporphyrinogen-III synthase [Undibacterium sp.]
MRNKAVVITRPAAQATSLAQRIAAMGRKPEEFPLLEILPLADSSALDAALSSLSDFALVAFVSPNAIDATFARIKSWPAGVSIGVMGAGSRAALAAHGVTDATHTIVSPIDAERTDSETLLAVLDLQALKTGRVLIIRGESGRELLADALRAHGIAVSQIAAYRRVAPAFTAERRQKLSAILKRENDWIVTSSEALRTLLAWTEELAAKYDIADAVAKMQQQHLIVPHIRIAETAQSLGFQSITLTASGDENLLVALQSRL